MVDPVRYAVAVVVVGAATLVHSRAVHRSGAAVAPVAHAVPVLVRLACRAVRAAAGTPGQRDERQPLDQVVLESRIVQRVVAAQFPA